MALWSLNSLDGFGARWSPTWGRVGVGTSPVAPEGCPQGRDMGWKTLFGENFIPASALILTQVLNQNVRQSSIPPQEHH